MAFKTEQQQRAGVLVKQAQALLSIHLVQIVARMQARLRSTSSSYERVDLNSEGHRLFFTVAFSATERGGELTKTLVQRVLRLSNHSGLMFNFQWGETRRDGADHVLTIPYDEKEIRAVEHLVAVGYGAGWDMTKVFLFLSMNQEKGANNRVREKRAVTTQTMPRALKLCAKRAGGKQEFSLHSFRSGGGGISRALAGDYLSSVVQKAYGNNPKAA